MWYIWVCCKPLPIELEREDKTDNDTYIAYVNKKNRCWEDIQNIRQISQNQ